jgi:hypothetical protein
VVVRQVARNLARRPRGRHLAAHLHHGHQTGPTLSSVPQIACDATEAPIHALFPTARSGFALPKAMAIPLTLALASGVPASTPIAGFGFPVGMEFPVAAAGIAAPRRAAAVGVGVGTNELSLNDLLTQPDAPVSPLGLVGDDALLPKTPRGSDLQALAVDSPEDAAANPAVPARTTVPEPPAWSLLALGGLALAALRWHRNRPLTRWRWHG